MYRLIVLIFGFKMMSLHLNEIAKQIPVGRHALVLLDQASWHTSQNLECSPRITLLPIPPYSPELNPMEQVWLWLKQVCLSNRVFDGLEQIVEESANAWNTFLEQCSIKILCSRKWARLEN